MSDKIKLVAEPREDSGKGASRRLRHTGMVPAIVYGGDKAPVSIMLEHNDFKHQLENEAIYTQLIDLTVNKKKEEVVLRDLQRHPYKNKIMHADFYRVDKKKPIHVSVPVHPINVEECVGVKLDGGMLSLMTSEIEVVCLPKDIPEYLEIDVTELHLGEILHLSQIQLPKGVEIAALMYDEDHEHDIGVVSVYKTRAEAVPDDAPEAPKSPEEGDDAAEADTE
ncbi:MAG: large subunit ribosomal protein L25 [Gammaproteobacteria bacterium]|jgi:large subunit ribosomal protein L25